MSWLGSICKNIILEKHWNATHVYKSHIFSSFFRSLDLLRSRESECKRSKPVVGRGFKQYIMANFVSVIAYSVRLAYLEFSSQLQLM